jgi:hypothetical protein
VDPAGDGSIPRPTFAREQMCELRESASDSGATSWGDGDMDYFGDGHTCARAPNVARVSWVVELAAGNPDVQGHTLGVPMLGCDHPLGLKEENQRLA